MNRELINKYLQKIYNISESNNNEGSSGFVKSIYEQEKILNEIYELGIDEGYKLGIKQLEIDE